MTHANQSSRYEIRLAGAGGQGIILASVILAKAALGNKRETLHVCQSQSYGPEARGGSCKAEVVISPSAIDYPKVIRLDLMLAMNQESCDAYSHDFKPDGILVVDSTFVEQPPTSRVVSLPFTRIARKETGRDLAANMAALGALAVICRHVGPKELEDAIASASPASAKEMNLKAFAAGQKAMREVDLSLLPRAIAPADPDETEL